MYEAYDASYQVFLENWLCNRQVAIDLMEQNLKPQGTEVSVLSAGAGPGDFDLQVIHTLKKQLPQLTLRYIAIEPNHLHRQRYEQKINSQIFNDVDLKLYPDKIQEFKTNEKFDIIHYTHSMYHMPSDEKQLVLTGIDMLKENGFLIITLCTAEAVIFDTIFRYAALTKQGYAEMLQMEQLQAIIDELGLSYKVVNYPEYLDVKLCFEDDFSGKVLLDFFCQDDSSVLLPEARKEILSILDNNAIQEDGRKLVPSPCGTMIIFR